MFISYLVAEFLICLSKELAMIMTLTERNTLPLDNFALS